MSKIKIAEMQKREFVSDTDLMICEDDIDTKQTTVRNLKRCFNGDASDPSDYKFYSSAKVDDLINGIEVELSHLPSSEEFNNLKQQVKNLLTSVGSQTGEKDPEIIAARGTYDTLADRLFGDQKENDSKYLRNKTAKFAGMAVDLSNFDSCHATIIATPWPTITTIHIESINIFRHLDIKSSSVTKTETGYKFIYQSNSYIYDIPCAISTPGEYTLYGSFDMSDDFVKDGFTLKLNYSDGSSTSTNYGFTKVFRFTVEKPLSSFSIVPNKDLIVDNMWLEMNSIMVSEHGDLSTYVKPYSASHILEAGDSDFILEVDIPAKCTITRTSGSMNITVIDTSYTTDDIIEELETIKHELAFSTDKCNRIEQQGTYIFPTMIQEDSKNLCILSKDYTMDRNSQPSIKIQLMDHDLDDQPRFTMVLDNPLNLEANSLISFQFYLDKTLSDYFTSEDGIKIMLSSDYEITNPCANYYFFNIGKDSFVQGWNTIKLRLDKFLPHGSPDITNITQINFRIYSSEFTAGKTLWFNSVIIDQRMRPTILFAFDDFQEDGFDYAYPYLYSRGIPATIFANDKKTLPRDFLNKIADLVYLKDWEIGNNGVNPNKEIMIEDDNSREQYMALRTSRDWLINNFQEDIVAYSAPFGNLRPLTMKILKKMGFKIAKANADNFCSFFGEDDFTIPMHLLSNEEGHGADDICDKIDYCVETGQTLCIYTSGVSRYGSEIEANKISFEKVIEKIKSYMEADQLDCMTFSQFYEECCK